jgi:plasmid stabilization system protein ParE
MRRYTISITEPAQSDIARSYAWGVREWGSARAKTWARELRAAIRGLAELPERHPLAPESDEFDFDIRQLIVGRYRILYTITDKRVSVLHVRGAFTTSVSEESE